MVIGKNLGIFVGILATAGLGFAGLDAVSAAPPTASKSSKSSKSLKSCDFQLDTTAGETGTAVASITRNSLRMKVTGAAPNSVYTIWIDFQSRATGQLADDYPTDPNAPAYAFHGPPNGRGVAPAFAATAGVKAGMGLDDNAFATDARGNANFRVALDYNLLARGASPMAAGDLVMQGGNTVGGGWLRLYTRPLAEGPSVQAIGRDGLPVLVRATVQGLTVVRHAIPVSHGHTPGVSGVDHFGAWIGDFPAACRTR